MFFNNKYRQKSRNSKDVRRTDASGSFRRLSVEPLEERRLLAAVLTLAPEDSFYQAEQESTLTIPIFLSSSVSGSVKSITEFKAGIFFDSQYLAKNDDFTPKVSLKTTYMTGLQSYQLKEDTADLDGDSATDWYYEITWWKATPSWLSGSDTRKLAEITLTIGSDAELGGYAAEFTVGANWLNAAQYSAWTAYSEQAQVYVDGELTAPVIQSVQTLDPGPIDTVLVQWNAVTGAGSYRLDYALNSKFSKAVSVTVTDTEAQISGLASETTYYFRVIALNPNDPTGKHDSSPSKTVSFTTSKQIFDLKTADGGTIETPLLWIGSTWSISDITVTNAGNGTVSHYTVSFYALADSVNGAETDWDSAHLIGTADGLPVAAGKTVTLSDLPLSARGLAAGESYTVAWKIDLEDDATPENNIGYLVKQGTIQKIRIFSEIEEPAGVQLGSTAFIEAEMLTGSDRYVWDFDGNGTTDAETAGSFYLDTSRYTTSGGKQITCRITDGEGNQSAAADLTLTLIPLSKQVLFTPAAFADGTILSLSLNAVHWETPIASWTINWGDQTQTEFSVQNSRLSTAHYYTAGQSYTIRLSIENAEGDRFETDLMVYAVPLPVSSGLTPTLASTDETESIEAQPLTQTASPLIAVSVPLTAPPALRSFSNRPNRAAVEALLREEEIWDTLSPALTDEEIFDSADQFSPQKEQESAVWNWDLDIDLGEF